VTVDIAAIRRRYELAGETVRPYADLAALCDRVEQLEADNRLLEQAHDNALELWEGRCAKVEADNQRLRDAGQQLANGARAGMKLLRTVFGSKGEFVYAAKEWLANTEPHLAAWRDATNTTT